VLKVLKVPKVNKVL